MDDFKKFSETNNFLIRSKNALKNCFTWSHNSPSFEDYAPQDLKDKVNEFISFLEKYKVENVRPKSRIAQGDFFDEEKTISDIKNKTGYIWKTHTLNDKEMGDEGFTSKDIEFNRNISTNKIKVIGFYRDANSRDELWLMRLVLMPGCAYITWATDRVSSSSEVCYSVEKLLKSL
jgi:hypothetical protein